MKMLKTFKPYLRNYKLLFTAVISFLLGTMVAVNLIPIDRTCRIEKSDREYNIMSNGKLKNPDLIVLVLSAPKNVNRRNTIRETWLKLARTSSDDENNAKFKMKHYFVIGTEGLRVDDVMELTTEQSKYTDMLILPMRDSYANLTMKVLKAFTWLHEQVDYGLQFKYMLKCDDDSFVRVDSLAHEIAHLEIMYLKSDMERYEDKTSPYVRINAQTNEYASHRGGRLQLYWGYFRGSARIKRTGKWQESNWILCDNYLPYALGGGYILSRELVRFLGRNSDFLRHYRSEDVSVGTWLAAVNNVLRIHDSRFDTEWVPRGCRNHYLITHNISEQQMRELYNNVVATRQLCSVESTKRKHYLYEWLLPPSQCCNI